MYVYSKQLFTSSLSQISSKKYKIKFIVKCRFCSLYNTNFVLPYPNKLKMGTHFRGCNKNVSFRTFSKIFRKFISFPRKKHLLLFRANIFDPTQRMYDCHGRASFMWPLWCLSHVKDRYVRHRNICFLI